MRITTDSIRDFPPLTCSELLRLSEVHQANDASLYKQTWDWIHNFLAKPHQDRGINGAVCPFVPEAIRQDTLWLASVRGVPDGVEQMVKIVWLYANLYLQLPGADEESAILNSILIIFPDIPLEQAPRLIDETQRQLKPDVVERGKMIGEFHRLNLRSGLHNLHFHPLQSPIPLLAIRAMVESDLPFLMRPSDPPLARARCLRAYLRLLHKELSPARVEQARKALDEAQAELQEAEAR